MYAVIRAGGKQYRVAPGDVLKIEKTSNHSDQNIEFEVLAVSGEEGKIAKAEDAKVIGEILGEGRADKILVFHFQAQETVQEAERTQTAVHPGADCGNQRRGRDLQGSSGCRKGTEGREDHRSRRNPGGHQGSGEESRREKDGKQEIQQVTFTG